MDAQLSYMWKQVCSTVLEHSSPSTAPSDITNTGAELGLYPGVHCSFPGQTCGDYELHTGLCSVEGNWGLLPHLHTQGPLV